MPPAAVKPIVLLVVDDSHKYVYEPSPPDGLLPFKAAGIAPEQIVCGAETVLLEITGLTVIPIAADTLFEQGPDITVLLYHVVAVNTPGMYPIFVFVPGAAVYPAVLLVVDDSHE